MIKRVPTKVKDALRSGNYKKEYKIVVDPDDYHNIGTFTVNKDYQTQLLKITYGDSGLNLRPNIDYRFKNDIGGSFNSFGIFDPEHSTEPITFETAINWGDYTTVDFRISEELEDNYEIIFYGGTANQLEIEAQEEGRFTIDNDHLVSESVKIDERMCSGSELKFGLCEGSSVEFQYFDFPNILGSHINITLRVQYEIARNRLDWYEIPMGQFDVAQCSRQASTGIIKATAYNKLKSEYLDQDCTARVTEILQDSPLGMASVSDILEALLNDYTIPVATYTEVNGYIYDQNINYTSDSGIRIYTVDGFPYNPPAVPVVNEDVIGKYFGIYTVDFYYIPSGEASTQTGDTYYYDFDFDALWDVIGSTRYHTAWQHVTGDDLFGVNNPYAVEETEGWYQIADSIYAGNVSLENGSSILYLRDHQSGHVQTPLFTGYYPKITIAVLVECDFTNGTETSPSGYTITNKISDEAQQLINDLSTANWVKIYKYYGSDIDSTNISVNDIKQGITLRDLQSASFEINCQYGKLDRVTDLFSGIELNNGALYPRDNLYPDNGLYPMGTAESGYPSMYSKLWADEGNVRSFRYLIITYKTTETIEGQVQEVEKTLQRTVNANGTDNYNMSDNWLFKNLVWTTSDVGDYADAMVTKMQGIRWFPFEMWCAGLPFLEAGDEIEIQMKEGTYKSYVLRRTLSGIQNLQDEMINGTLDIF